MDPAWQKNNRKETSPSPFIEGDTLQSDSGGKAVEDEAVAENSPLEENGKEVAVEVMQVMAVISVPVADSVAEDNAGSSVVPALVSMGDGDMDR